MQAKTLMCGLAAATLLSVGFAALPTQDAAASAAPSRAQRDFERIKALAGDWEAVGEAGESGDWNFRVSAGGSAVLETLFVGTEHEMLTVYHMEDGELVLTHY